MAPRPDAEPGRVVGKAIDDEDWPFYWHAFIGDRRVNGGLCKSQYEGYSAGREAIDKRRRAIFYETHYWDEETADWYPVGTAVD